MIMCIANYDQAYAQCHVYTPQYYIQSCSFHCHNTLCNIALLVACLCRKGSDDKIEMTTEDNPAYGLSGPHKRHGETKDEYEYIQSSPAAPQEAVYEGV